MTNLPIREIVLYKHGVGFFARGGDVSGESIQLEFHANDLNDVLKSLAIFDWAGGTVYGIHYQTEANRNRLLDGNSFDLSSNGSVRDLVRSLRGRQVTLLYQEGDKPRTLSGRMIGFDVSEQKAERVVILASDNQMKIIGLENVHAIRVVDSQAEQDLAYFLDASLSETKRRTIQVRLSPGDHKLVIYYVAPSPAWRVSYRLVAEAPNDKGVGKALLQGWGLFDNTLDEDLQDVRVTFVAGQPISFVYDLASSQIPQRPVVRDTTRVASGPIEYRLMDGSDEQADDFLPTRLGGGRSGPPMAALRGMPSPAMSPKRMEQSAPPVATGQDANEAFQYAVSVPVSIKRGESAMLPILSVVTEYERELLYNGTKLPKHPSVAYRLKNSSGLTLERGPATVVEAGVYKGEAIVPFTKAEGSLYIPYAVELGVRVTEAYQEELHEDGVALNGDALIYLRSIIRTTTYTLESQLAQASVVTIETAVLANCELSNMRPPDAHTATEWRWHVDVPARGKASFSVTTRERQKLETLVSDLAYEEFARFVAQNWLDEATHARIKEVVDLRETVNRLVKRREEIEAEQKRLMEQQDQLRKNISALQSSDAALRQRLVKQLELTQDRLETLEREHSTATTKGLAGQKRLDALLKQFGVPQNG